MKIKLLHISKIIKTVVITLVILSCSNPEITSRDLKKGVYTWVERSDFKTYYYYYILNTTFEKGDTLTLFDNDDFKYTNCGYYGFGKYFIEGDSLHLNFDSTATHYDSILTEDKTVYSYFIEDENILTTEYRTKKTRDGPVDGYGISELHFVRDSVGN